MQPRRHARIAVLQALYEMDLTGHDPLAALDRRLEEEPLEAGGQEFALHLLTGVVPRVSALDDIIRQIAPEWPAEQLPAVDRNILRIAAFELLCSTMTPRKVAINEAVELAKLFGGEHSARFVNGALGALADRQNDFAQRLQTLT